MSKGFSKKLLEKLQKKTNTKVDAKQLEVFASKVNKDDLSDEGRMLQLIRQLSKMANVQLDKEKEEKIIKYLRNNDIKQADMKTVLSLLNKKLD
ncbi:stage VI sporulation protein F [Ammoniphilus resinae]|uniref:Phage antirepressor YoqD-like protein n=1 Tax=Ammoniphilus resinae TaxID=861532 RepID=A0ABS4GT54_9BACL|nr:stage VI sporulation protein F [Ammoniphilus resinae]MBP1933467.1 phage antirepressor YoqD-like protein [Ammoniphilus resinae]